MADDLVNTVFSAAGGALSAGAIVFTGVQLTEDGTQDGTNGNGGDGGNGGGDGMGVVEDGEGDLSAYSGEQSYFAIDQSNPISGGGSVFASGVEHGSYRTIASTTGLDLYPGRGDTFECKLQILTDNTYGAVLFGVQGESHPWPCYRLRLDTGSGPGVALEEIPPGGPIEAHLLDDQYRLFNDQYHDNPAYEPTVGTVYTCRIKWGTDDSITVTVVSENGNILLQDTASDPSYTGGGVGFMASSSWPDQPTNEVRWDDYRVVDSNGGNGGGDDDEIQSDIPVTNGLVGLWEPPRIQTDGAGTVTGWVDDTGQNNDLNAIGGPQVVSSGTPNGSPAVRFDGNDDALETASATGLPTGSADRTMFLVCNYRSIKWGGLAYGNHAPNQAFGLTINDIEEYEVQGWGDPNDFPSGVNALTRGWGTQSVVLQSNGFEHYLNGSTIDSNSHAFETVGQLLVMGAELDYPPFVDMDISAGAIYNRALSDTERQDVESYFQNQFLSGIAQQQSGRGVSQPQQQR